MVIAHLRCVISYIAGQPSEATIKFLDDSMREVYSYLDFHHSSPQAMNKLIQLEKFIWQDGCFLSPNQIVGHWNYNCVPYLCELSSTNKRYSRLMTKVSVKDEATLETLVDVLQRIEADHGTCTPISDEILEFVVYTSGRLYHKLRLSDEDHSFTIHLPDENKIMRTVSELADNIGSEWVKSLPAYQDFMNSGTGYFVHKSIPCEHAKYLGVNPLLEAVLKEIEDEDFLCGTDFGQHEDLCDRLNGILKKYPADISIFKEFIQNADDAQATELIFVMDHRTDFPDNTLLSSNSKWKSLQHTPALCILNNRKFTEADLEGITKLGRGGKSGSADLIGKFGIGFNVAYHVTDCPSFVSYSESGAPEYLCVFDPTQSFAPCATRRSPGRKWNFKHKHQHLGFSDQFQPYLPKDLHRLSEHTSDCLLDFKSYGYVVFRLPLTRYNSRSESHYDERKRSMKLTSGYTFYPTSISRLFKEFASISQDVLLFLNHLRSMSAFEISKDGSLIHHFTTTASIPSAYLENCKYFSQCLKQQSQTKRISECISVAHKMEISHVQPDSDTQHTQWLIQRVIGGSGLQEELLQAGLNQGLRPVAGVATLLKPPSTDHKYHLFCFLPLPIQSNLPVHVNGHFLVDDSRKHLESIKHVGLDNWNESIAQKVVVPAYVDLIMTVKDLLDADYSSDLYYSLFPKELTNWSYSATEVSKEGNVGELSNLNIVRSFYSELLQRNPSVLILDMPIHSSVYTWVNVKDCHFCVPFVIERTQTILTVCDELRSALVSLGLPITTAPNYIYDECLRVDHSFARLAAIEPRKVTDHLRGLVCTAEHKETIKNNIHHLLQYCISGYDLDRIPELFNDALYLVASDGSLQRGRLFQSSFSNLIPHYPDKFIDHSLEASKVGERLLQCNVICPLTLKFVSNHINLPETAMSCALSDSSSDIIKLLWEYFIHCSQRSLLTGSESVPSLLNKYFSSKAIIPASDGKLYPVRLSKILIRDSFGTCDNCSVMKKLGYPQNDFEKIGIAGRNQLLFNIICDLTSCFQTGEDIINCFQLQPPINSSIHLTDDEVYSFISSLGKLSVGSLQQVSNYLLEMPLFHTIDELRITLCGVTKVFILALTNLPLEGIPTSHNGQVVLKAATSDSMKKFYEGVIPRSISACVSPEEFYMQLVLPILPQLQEENIKAHVDYIHLQRNKMKHAFAMLKKTCFIKHNEMFFKASDLCDHTVEFYTTFKPEYILPITWQDRAEILKNLDLQTKVSTTEWLECARKFSDEVTVDEAEYKSRVLFKELIEVINHYPHSLGLMVFLQNVADIEFLYSPQIWELNRILSALFPKDKHSNTRYHCMVKFKGSVSVHEADLACLCKSILPETCQNLITQPLFRRALFVELPASPETVAENLKFLCNCISVTCVRSLCLNSAHVSKLIQIFEAHYACLSKKKPSPNILCELKDMMCILPFKSQLFQLVKPSQLVMQLPSDCILEPYCFKVEPWLQKHEEFLTAVGVKQQLTAQDYVDILSSIKKEVEDDGGIHDKDSKVIESAYKELISRLRREDSINRGINTVIYLPDEDLNLKQVTELCLNDAPWYKSRLPSDCSFKIILQPPTDDKGHRTLPDSLKVKRLSEIVTEELQESCKSPDFICNDEELFQIGKRPETGRCVFVRNIFETLKSDELFDGFCRMYYTEYKNPPTESFKLLVQKLKQVKVHCVVGELKSMLSINGQPIPATDDTSKLCHLCHDNDTTILYIAPHNKALEDSELSSFFKDLAICISKLIDNEIECWANCCCL